jgi:signal transduction histidine kinase
MAVRPILVGAVAGAAGAVGVESLVVVRAGPAFSAAGTAPFGPVMLLVAGWAAVAAGLVVAWRRPARRSWLLLVAAGFALLLAEWDNPAASSAVVFSVGLLLTAAPAAVIAHLALSFPSGRLGASLDRAVVAIGYAVAIGLLGLAVAATFDPTSAGCRGCPTNLWLIHGDAQLSTNLSRAGLRCGLVWSGLVVLVLALRLITSTAARRRAAGPVWALTIADLLAVAASYRHGLDRGFIGSDVVQARLWLAQAVALLLISALALFALIRSRLSQRGLTRLVIDLGNATRPGQLRAALAQRLGDPDLVLAYPVDGGQRYVDAQARNLDLTRTRPDRPRTSLAYDGSEIATLVHRRGILDTPEAVGELVSAVHLALQNERLHAEALTQLADLRSSGSRMLTTGDEERRHLEQDLHDGAQQRLISLALALRLLQSRATTAKNDLDHAETEVRKAIDELRHIAHGLYPIVLRESGLAAALAALAEQRLLRIGDIPETRYPAVVESTAYRLVALASQRSPANVSIDDHGKTITVHVDIDADLPDLTEVRDRATTLNGQLTVSDGDTRSQATLVLPVHPGVPTQNDQSLTKT